MKILPSPLHATFYSRKIDRVSWEVESMGTQDSESEGVGWTFLSNHAHVLVVLARDPEMRLRDVAEVVGITERAVQRIVADLELGGFLTREKIGRRNRYTLHRDEPLRHPIDSHRTIGQLLTLILSEDSGHPKAPSEER
jgi:hypothetical protein